MVGIKFSREHLLYICSVVFFIIYLLLNHIKILTLSSFFLLAGGSVSVFCFFHCKKNLNWLVVFLGSICTIVFAMLFYFFKGYIAVTFIVTFFSCLAMVFLIIHNCRVYLLLYFIFYIYCFIICFLLLFFIDVDELYSSSRNSVSLLLVCLGSFFILLKEKVNKKDLLLLFIILICCVLASGRSGILSAFALFSFSFLSYLKGGGYKKYLFLLLSLSALGFFVFFVFNFTNYFDYILYKGIEDSARRNMNYEYLNGLDLNGILYGIDLSILPIISSLSNNPHNTFILMHANLGFFAIIFFIVSFLGAYRFLLDIGWVYFMIVLAVFFRLSTDGASGLSLFPFLLIFLKGFILYDQNFKIFSKR